MNTFAIFALVICAIFAMVSATPEPKGPPAEKKIDGLAPEAIPDGDDMLEGAESRGYYGYNRGWGGGGWGGGGRGHYGHGHYGHGHYGHGHYGHGHHHHGYGR